MSSFAYVVAACSKYTAELCALLGSLDYVGNKFDVHLIGVDLPEKFTSQFPLLDYNVIHHAIPREEVEEARGISEITCRKRYWYAVDFGGNYEATCILDADLIFCRNPWQYFEMAAQTGFILGPCKEQNKVYDDPHHEVDGKWIWNVPRGFYNDKDLCNCPVFLNTELWRAPLVFSWDIFFKHGFRAPDMDAMNLSFLHFGGYEKIVPLPGNQWLGTNEQHLKPYIRAVERRGKIFTESGIPVYSYHGHYHHPKWRATQLDNRHGCAAGYLKATECSDAMASGAMDLLYSNFRKMLNWKIQIEKVNYRHPELPYEE